MFHDRTITSLHEKYLQEQIDCDMSDSEELTTPAPLISLIDKQASGRVCVHRGDFSPSFMRSYAISKRFFN